MPLYEYVCDECGDKFEKLVQRSQADGVQACPKCRSEQTRRVVSACASRSSLSAGGASASCAPSGG